MCSGRLAPDHMAIQPARKWQALRLPYREQRILNRIKHPYGVASIRATVFEHRAGPIFLTGNL